MSPVFSPTDFVAVLNQTLEYAYPGVTIVGELSNFRISKNKWVYFDLKDDYSSVKFFGSVYQLPGPLEDGMLLQIRGTPRLHQLYGFSVNIQSIRPVGEGSLKKAAALLEAKLTKEGLFEPARKRLLPLPPKTIGLVTSGESAAYADFIKIINARWGGVEIMLADVQVQGEPAVGQITTAIEHFNSHHEPVDVLAIIRGGGSADDLAAFSTEQVTRAVAASRIPTIVAIGHENDISLAELAADQRASTPSNAAELLVPDKKQVSAQLAAQRIELGRLVKQLCANQRTHIQESKTELYQLLNDVLIRAQDKLKTRRHLLEALSPQATLERGYAIVSLAGKTVYSAKQLKPKDRVSIRLKEGSTDAIID